VLLLHIIVVLFERLYLLDCNSRTKNLKKCAEPEHIAFIFGIKHIVGTAQRKPLNYYFNG